MVSIGISADTIAYAHSADPIEGFLLHKIFHPLSSVTCSFPVKSVGDALYSHSRDSFGGGCN
jgi:hypothetical protein